uniref:Uncharacterized protein n=1 Tax=Populus trichocarpa TaxID=3694 RepID=B9N4I5_POPTR
MTSISPMHNNPLLHLMELNSFLDFLFELIVARGPSAGFDVSLNGFDLFHGHVFIAAETRRLGSTVAYDSRNLRNILWLAPLPSSSIKAWVAPANTVIIKWNSQVSCHKYCVMQFDIDLTRTLVVLDARPDGIIYRDLIPEYVNFARTIYEGHVVVDVNYLNVEVPVPNYQIFIC